MLKKLGMSALALGVGGTIIWGSQSHVRNYNDVACIGSFCKGSSIGECFAKFGVSNESPLFNPRNPYNVLRDGKEYTPVITVTRKNGEFLEGSKYSFIKVKEPNFFGDNKIVNYSLAD
ncbi:MAG: hypothetical protein V1888_04225 [archaeon]